MNRVFNTSLEVGVKVYAEKFKEGSKLHSNSAFLTFVSVDSVGKPMIVPPATPETEDEKRRFDEALYRRENRLKDRNK